VTPILRLQNITKRFPGVLANDHICLEIEKGEIHALLGENGAGKTTLMNILYGLCQPQEGEVYFDGQLVKISSSLEAIQLGIGMVHQHFMLIPVFTVAENVILGQKLSQGVILKTDEAAKRIEELSKAYSIDVDPSAYIWQIPVGTQQRVEILKALYRNAKLLILDEPTAVLTPEETEALFIILRLLAEQGTSIIFISHKLNEVMSISNRVTVLRNGRVIDTVLTKDTSPRELARMMVGREVVLRVEREESQTLGEAKLNVTNLEALNDKGLTALKKISFQVNAGEILGIAGVDGNGQKELAEVLTGLRKPTGGKIIVDETNLSNAEPADFIQAGIAFIPQDRKKTGSIGDSSIAENAILRSQSAPPFANFGFMKWKNINQYADDLIHTFDVRTPSSRVLAKSLSGGNLQKLIIGREITRAHKILIAMQPVRGLDVAATEFVYNTLLDERRNGSAILLISTELDEILSLTDRILIIYEGNFVGEMCTDEADIHKMSLLMAGATEEA
jgi:general nucleoside transport system ATP-binding protein